MPRTNRWGDEIRRLTVDLPAELVEALKAHALERKQTVTAMIEEWVRGLGDA